MTKNTIGVMFGGRSSEHDISIITGQFIISKLKDLDYPVKAIYIDKNGKWLIGEELEELKFFKGDYQKKLSKFPDYAINLNKSTEKLVLDKKSVIKKDSITIDFMFPAFHGLNGEDGSIQGMLEFLNIPYAGCGIYTSSIAIDKVYTKKFLRSLELPITKYLTLTKNEFDINNALDAVTKNLNLPIFVKPATAGSSIGITKVKKIEDLEDAIKTAFYYDNKIIIENSVENVSDLTCGVLSDGKSIIISEIQESMFSDDLFDFNTKYEQDGGAQIGGSSSNIKIPAEIDPRISKQIKHYSNLIFKQINGNGIMRIDFLLDKTSNQVYVNELNTMPGTLTHHLWEASGVDDFLEKILSHGKKRWEDAKKIQKDYSTEVLNNANSMKLQN